MKAELNANHFPDFARRSREANTTRLSTEVFLFKGNRGPTLNSPPQAHVKPE